MRDENRERGWSRLLDRPLETLAGRTTELNVVEEDRLVQRQEQFRGGAGMKNRPRCSVWESLGVGKEEAASVLFVCLADESVSKRSAHLSDTTYTGSVAALG